MPKKTEEPTKSLADQALENLAVRYFMDRDTKVVIAYDAPHEIREMGTHPNYIEVSRAVYDEYMATRAINPTE